MVAAAARSSRCPLSVSAYRAASDPASAATRATSAPRCRPADTGSPPPDSTRRSSASLWRNSASPAPSSAAERTAAERTRRGAAGSPGDREESHWTADDWACQCGGGGGGGRAGLEQYTYRYTYYTNYTHTTQQQGRRIAVSGRRVKTARARAHSGAVIASPRSQFSTLSPRSKENIHF